MLDKIKQLLGIQTVTVTGAPAAQEAASISKRYTIARVIVIATIILVATLFIIFKVIK